PFAVVADGAWNALDRAALHLAIDIELVRAVVRDESPVLSFEKDRASSLVDFSAFGPPAAMVPREMDGRLLAARRVVIIDAHPSGHLVVALVRLLAFRLDRHRRAQVERPMGQIHVVAAE